MPNKGIVPSNSSMYFAGVTPRGFRLHRQVPALRDRVNCLRNLLTLPTLGQAEAPLNILPDIRSCALGNKASECLIVSHFATCLLECCCNDMFRWKQSIYDDYVISVTLVCCPRISKMYVLFYRFKCCLIICLWNYVLWWILLQMLLFHTYASSECPLMPAVTRQKTF